MTRWVDPNLLERRLGAVGTPSGGLTGEVLTKSSDDDYDTEWSPVTVSIPPGSITTTELADDSVTAAKIVQGTAGQVLMSNATPDTAWTTVTGDVTISATGVTTISAGAVTDADINASAAIASSKLAATTPGYILIGTTTTGVPTFTAITGAVTITPGGIVQIAAGAVKNAEVSATAAIAYSKLNLSTSLLIADLSTATGELGGAWQTDTVTSGFTNVSSGNCSRRWIKLGKTLIVRMYMTAGTATASGVIGIPLPGSSTAGAGQSQPLTGSNGQVVFAYVTAGATSATVTSSAAGANFAAGASLTSVRVNAVIEIQ